ncbi:hypothetical protein F2Q70_00011615 [Brassica cretica]|uniref:Uncharacterized protein n=1 Tax=Brassica cretica TaxID=69181 RepID=A0A8S9M6V8_BRACR|nr:hypothetical protein F2Q70_00011615 [Brassica cretica]
MNAHTNQSEGTPRKSIRSKNPNSADKRLPSINTPVSTSIDSHSKPKLSLSTKKNMSIDYDFLLPDEFGIFRDQDGHARAMDGRILQVSREDIADILQVANGPDNLFTQLRSIPDNNPAVPDEHSRATTTRIGSHQSCRPVGQTSIDEVVSKPFDRVTQTSIGKASSPSIDRRYKCRRRAYDSYGARKFRWEHKDEYGVYRDESGLARSAAGDMIPVTKDDIRKILITSHETEAEKMNAPTNQSEGTSRKNIRSKNPNSADKHLPSIDTPVSTSIDSHSKPKLSLSTKKNMSIDYDFLLPDEFGIFRDQDGHARAMDGRILQVSREDIADILQVANGPANLFTQQRSIPDNNPAVPDEHSRATIT